MVEKFISPQIVCVNGFASTVGVGFTVIENVVEVEAQPSALAIIVNVVV